MIALETAHNKQLSQAIPPFYMKQFRSRHSNVINVPIPMILTTLFFYYGKMSEETLLEKQDRLCAKFYNLTVPLIMMFNDIKDLQEMAVVSSSPYTPAQIINLGLKLIKICVISKKGSSHGMRYLV